MAKAPIDTPASPFSRRTRVPCDTPMRAAKSASAMRRFRRAMPMSRPKARNARCTDGV